MSTWWPSESLSVSAATGAAGWTAGPASEAPVLVAGPELEPPHPAAATPAKTKPSPALRTRIFAANTLTIDTRLGLREAERMARGARNTKRTACRFRGSSSSPSTTYVQNSRTFRHVCLAGRCRRVPAALAHNALVTGPELCLAWRGTMPDACARAVSGGGSILKQIAEIQRRVLRAIVIANSAGALVTFSAVGNVIPVFYSSSLSNRTGIINGPLAVAMVAIGISLGFRLGDRRFDPIRSWLLADCPPDSEAAAAALVLPLRTAKLTAALWLAGAALFALFNALLVSLAFGLLVAVTIVLGGLTTS